jgi:photosystem II stability/assembly factor-like uncharacterized protein
MKTKLLIAFLLLGGIANAQTWFQVTSNTTKNLWGVSFVNQNLGFVCGNSGTILKTSDGGINWVPQNSGTNYQLSGLQFIDDNIGYCASYSDNGGILLKTVNGGASWNNISLNLTNSNSGGFWFFSADTGILALGDNAFSHSKILKTNNGGASWDTVYNGGNGWISFIHFPNRNNGYATVSGSQILKTTNGGNNWDLLSNIGGNLWMSGVYFFNKDTGFVGGGDFNTGGGSIFKTTDGGITWQTQTNDYGTSVMLYTTFKTGYAIGSNVNWNEKKIIKTIDGGTTWAIDITPKYKLNSIFFPNTNNGYAVGDSGVIIKYGNMTSIKKSEINLNITVYNNPSNKSVTLKFNNIAKNNFTLTVYDTKGRLVRTIANIITDKVEINKQDLTIGIYFFQLYTRRNIIATGKLTIE